MHICAIVYMCTNTVSSNFWLTYTASVYPHPFSRIKCILCFILRNVGLIISLMAYEHYGHGIFSVMTFIYGIMVLLQCTTFITMKGPSVTLLYHVGLLIVGELYLVFLPPLHCTTFCKYNIVLPLLMSLLFISG